MKKKLFCLLLCVLMCESLFEQKIIERKPYKLPTTWELFVDAMEDYIQYPRAFECSNCKKKTVQDVVSYSPNGGE